MPKTKQDKPPTKDPVDRIVELLARFHSDGAAEISFSALADDSDTETLGDLIGQAVSKKAKKAPLPKDAANALQIVSFYARINHGDKCKDYGEIVDPVLKKHGLPTGEHPQ